MPSAVHFRSKLPLGRAPGATPPLATGEGLVSSFSLFGRKG